MRAEAADGTIGDGIVEIGTEHPAFAAWDAYLPDAPGSDSSRSEQIAGSSPPTGLFPPRHSNPAGQ